jgi:formate C-acetyltransferase
MPQLAHPDGPPDAYGRGRIIGDYRRVALYGVTRLIERKQEEKAALDDEMSTDEVIRDREELSEQIRALKELQKMAASYGFDISGPGCHREGGRAVAVLRLSRRREGAERRGDVAAAAPPRSSTSTSRGISPQAR